MRKVEEKGLPVVAQRRYPRLRVGEQWHSTARYGNAIGGGRISFAAPHRLMRRLVGVAPEPGGAPGGPGDVRLGVQEPRKGSYPSLPRRVGLAAVA